VSSNRQEYRQHTKGTLLRAAQVLFAQNNGLEARLRQAWRRRVLAAAAVAFVLGLVAGAGVGAAAARGGWDLTSRQVARILGP
jgi:hypothetical protein